MQDHKFHDRIWEMLNQLRAPGLSLRELRSKLAKDFNEGGKLFSKEEYSHPTFREALLDLTSRIGHFSRLSSETARFLKGCVVVCPEYYSLFFTALRSGLRKSELIALKWGDIQFGESEEDKNRFILVQRHYYMGHFGTSKTHECRRVDMSKQLRAVLMARKEEVLLRAFQLGKTSVADD